MSRADYIGVDPGLDGGIALLTRSGLLSVVDMPAIVLSAKPLRRVINASVLAGMLAQHRGARAIVELVASRPGQGVRSMFSFGRGFGTVEGVLAALEIPVIYVTPQQWRRDLNVPNGKTGSLRRASKLLPRYASQWKRVRDDGRAEAALIAVWGRDHGGASP